MANEKNPNELPETAIMTPLDSVAVPKTDVEKTMDALTVVDIPGMVSDNANRAFDLFKGPPANTPGITGQTIIDAAGVMNPFNPTSIQNQIQNYTGSQYPVDLTTGQPIPEQPVIPTDGTIAGAIQPVATPVVQKVGETKTETALPTQGTKESLANARQDVKDVDQAMDRQVGIAEDLANLKGQVDQSRLAEADKFAQRSEELYQLAQDQAQESRNEIKRLRDQYASMSWDTYWGSKDVGDKLMLGLAVGLGALSQSQIGGQNLAMTLIQSNVEDHNKFQTAKFRNLEAQLTSAQNYSVEAQQAIKGQYANLVAQNSASYDQLDKQLAAISSKANTQKARNDAENMRYQLKLKNDQNLFSMEKELDGRSTMTQDVFKEAGISKDPARFVTFDGKPMNENQSKSYSYLLQGAPAVKTMEELEDQGLTNTQQFADVRKALINEGRGGGLNGVIDAASAALQIDNAVARYAAGNVAIQNYFRNARIATGQKLRLESGSAIAPSEYLGEILKYVPNDITSNRSAATQASDLMAARQARRNFLTSFKGASQSGNKLWFEEGK